MSCSTYPTITQRQNVRLHSLISCVRLTLLWSADSPCLVLGLELHNRDGQRFFGHWHPFPSFWRSRRLALSLLDRRIDYSCRWHDIVLPDASRTDANEGLVQAKRLVYGARRDHYGQPVGLTILSSSHSNELQCRILRDDPTKSDMHNREGLTIGMIWNAICDWRMWPIYVLGITHMSMCSSSHSDFNDLVWSQFPLDHRRHT